MCVAAWRRARSHATDEWSAPLFPLSQDVPPIITTSKSYLFNILRSDLFFVASVAAESPPLMVIEFLHRIFDVFTDYFGDVHEASVKRNFSTVYQVRRVASRCAATPGAPPPHRRSRVSPAAGGAGGQDHRLLRGRPEGALRRGGCERGRLYPATHA